MLNLILMFYEACRLEIEEGKHISRSKTELIKQMLINIDGQSPSSTMSLTKGEEGDYPSTPPPTPFGTPHSGAPYFISGKLETGNIKEADASINSNTC